MFPLAFLLLGLAGGAVDPPPAASAIEEAGLRQLVNIKRVYVDRLTGGETAAQMRDILLSSMAGADLFILTENPERADATLRGAAEDLVFTDVHTSSDGVNAHANVGSGKSANQRPVSAGISLGENESEHSTDRRHEALAA